MGVTTNSLRELHHLHRRLSDLRGDIERGPRQLDAKRRHLTLRTEALEKDKAELKAHKVHAHAKETERKGLDGRLGQLQLQINTAKSNKEYSTLVTEREAVAKARAKVEDELLEIMLQEEEKNQAIESGEAETRRLQQELAELESAITGQQASLSAELAAAESQLRAAEETLPKDMKDAYQRLLGRRGADALAPVKDVTCTGCYTDITPQMHNLLLLNELVLCKSCGRILYLEEAAATVKVE